ncbi:MAG: hypothetical protein R2912_13190 [Eubacteriales bacterium]
MLKLIPQTRPVFDAHGLPRRGDEGFGLGGLHCIRRNLLDGSDNCWEQGRGQ